MAGAEPNVITLLVKVSFVAVFYPYTVIHILGRKMGVSLEWFSILVTPGHSEILLKQFRLTARTTRGGRKCEG